MTAASALQWSKDGLLHQGSYLFQQFNATNVDGTLELGACEGQRDYGTLLSACTIEPKNEWRCSLGVATTEILRWSACHRYEPFWMIRATGTSISEIPPETQFLIMECTGNRYLLVIPLVNLHFHASLTGTNEGDLHVIVESGDTSVVDSQMDAVYLSIGSDPYSLVRDAAKDVATIIPGASLRKDKPLPKFVEWFGWCTWDAFYQDVSHEKVIQGLMSFKLGGVLPRFVILDDGWQQVNKVDEKIKRLSGFSPNEKFDGNLTQTVAQARELGVQYFIVWHALNGYWGGVDPQNFSQYDARLKSRSFSAGILHHSPSFNTEYWGSTVGLVPANRIFEFFNDYYRKLSSQGVDGVKVDNQCAVEAVGEGEGGRVALMLAYHKAIEEGAQHYFGGNLINCMSCASEVFYQSTGSTLIRTSTDFWPKRPETHGLHLVTNAHVSLWFSNFMHPDWDMFQSGHEAGTYHAAARAISGAPVYVSDKPDGHDFDLLKKLVLPDGSILRCSQPALPTRDSLFTEPLTSAVPLKIFNFNALGGVIGLFHALHCPDDPIVIDCTASPADIPGLTGRKFISFGHQTRQVYTLGPQELQLVHLEPGSFEIITIVPVINGIAPIGLVEMFNSAGAIMALRTGPNGSIDIHVRGEGPFGVWSETKPSSVATHKGELHWVYDAHTGLVTFELERGTEIITITP